MTIKLYNSRTREIEEFKSVEENLVKIYTCGPTAYDFMHIGNLRTAFFTDCLKRMFLISNYKVLHCMNITDFGHIIGDADTGEDKMTIGLKRENLPRTLEGMRNLAKKYTEFYNQDLAKLNVISPDIIPNASEYIPEYMDMINLLQDKGFAYNISDGIYFDTSKDLDYGKMALLDRKKDDKNRIEIKTEKKNAADFCLWKFANKENGDVGFDTDNPKILFGFPGWHIECSGMAKKFLGETFDIHTGGIDLMPVHHINEIAQSENANGKTFCNFFCHGEMLNIKNEKMSKSKNNYLTMNSILENKYSPLVYRYFLLQTHYRRNLNFSWESMEASQTALEKLQKQMVKLSEPLPPSGEAPRSGEGVNVIYFAKFLEFIQNDLHTPKALALVWTMLKDKQVSDSEKYWTIKKMDQIFGLGL
jgi:cysteinyl-tRNA synthetase